MSTFKYRLLSNWHVARIIRAALAVFMLVLSIQTRDWVIGLASALLLLMAVTNTRRAVPCQQNLHTRIMLLMNLISTPK